MYKDHIKGNLFKNKSSSTLHIMLIMSSPFPFQPCSMLYHLIMEHLLTDIEQT